MKENEMLPNFFEYSFLGFSFFLIFFLSHMAWTYFCLGVSETCFLGKKLFFANKCVFVCKNAFFIENEFKKKVDLEALRP